jgi:hypothetical protein
MKPPAELIAEYIRLEDWMKAETKRFNEHMQPVKTRLEEIKEKELRQHLLALGSQDKQTISTDNGTVYLSTITTPSISDEGAPYEPQPGETQVGRNAYLEWCIDHWPEWGNQMLQLAAPQVTAVRDYMDQNGGQPPPGVKITTFNRVNIRRS